MQNKKILLAPLLGSAISVFIFSIYLISTVNYSNALITDVIFSFIKVFPLITVLIIFLNYLVCITIGIPLIYFKNKYLLSFNFFWFISFIIFFIIGLIFAIINYQIEFSIAKFFAIFLSFLLGGLFSTSLYSVLNGDVPRKNK